jgi:hypothetical protein
MIIFVGDKPSPKMKPGAKPFEGAACEKRLKDWIYELTHRSFFSDIPYKIVNQADIPFGTFFSWHWRGDSLMALGNNASKALGNIPHFKLPPPSGLNRQLNDKKFIYKKIKDCKAWLRK